VLTTNEILTGLGLVIVLGLGCRLLADRLRLPAIVLLLGVGFVAGIVTDDVHPDKLFGDTFQPLVSLGVGLILFEAGLRLRLDELGAGVRTVVLRLISLGALLTLAGVMLSVKLIFGLSWGVSAVLGAILVVSGPTVVLPLLAFVRPSERVRSTLKWEGTLIDPIGALLGVVAFQVVAAGGGGGYHPGELTESMGVGLAVGAIGAGLLWLLLRGFQRSTPRQSIGAALMVVVAVLISADLIREDSGFVATVTMGIVLANQRQLDISGVLEFQGTVVEMLIGMLFVLISASVTPSEVGDVLPEGLILVAVMVLVIRPLVVALGTLGSQLTAGERAFTAWMAPRGIVAAATASSFGIELTQAGVSGADRILPIAFVAILGTVVLYGLSATPVARLLGVAGAGAPVVLVVGGHPWAQAIAGALKKAGLGVRLWTGEPNEQAAARKAGLDAGQARLGVDVASREAELEAVNAALIVTESDDFNALAAFELRQELGSDRVYRLAPQGGTLDLVPEYAEGGILFGRDLTYAELTRRFEAGAKLVELSADRDLDRAGADGMTPLFIVTASGGFRAITTDARPESSGGETAICLAETGSSRPVQ
jgi:NhaP-type Na+/H+ or K+/H+ antiporter